MITTVFFLVGLCFWALLAFSFLAHFCQKGALLDAVSAVACLLACVGPARELKLLPIWAATPLYVLGLFASCGGVCVVLVFEAQRRRNHL